MFENDRMTRLYKWIMTAAVAILLVVAAGLVWAVCSTARANPIAADPSQVSQPQFKVIGMGVNPSQVNPGESVFVVATIVNSGNTDGVYNAQLKVNGLVEAVGDISIPAGGSREVKFSMSKNSVQEYTVNLGNMNGKFDVVAPQAQNTALAGAGVPSGLPSCCQTSATAGTTSYVGPAAVASCCGGGQSVATQNFPTQRSSCCGN